MRFIFQEVNVETIEKGRSKYQVANVVYTANGSNRNIKIMSFANPEVFKTVTGLRSGQAIDVDITKNDRGYDQWAKVVVATEGAAAPATPATTTKGVSQYETREERLERQLHIVRQSSLSNAINALSVGSKSPPTKEAIIELAEAFVDFVYGNDEVVTVNNDEFTDIPH